MSESQLADLERLADAATPGPWHVDEDWTQEVLSRDGTLIVKLPHERAREADFIAASRTAIPALLADLREARASLVEARRLLERAVPCIVVAVENCPLEDEEMARNVLADIDAALGKVG